MTKRKIKEYNYNLQINNFVNPFIGFGFVEFVYQF
jgi:hypothetical protein